MNAIDAAFWSSQYVSGLSTGEGLINKVADKKKMGKDGEEEIVEADKRVYAKESEFSRVLVQRKREGNVLSQVIRDAFDSGDLAVLTRSLPLEAKGSHISITGHITSEELVSNLDSIEIANGFGNRFLWIVTKSSKIMPASDPIPESVLKFFSIRFRKAIRLASKCGRTEMSDSAKALWIQLYPQLRMDKPGIVGAMSARGATFVLRIALIYALISGSRKIETVHLKAAMAVWNYNLDSIQILFNGRSCNSLADKILAILASGPKRTTEFHSHLGKPAKEIRMALGELEKAGRVKCEKPKQSGPGRPMEIWALVDQLNKLN